MAGLVAYFTYAKEKRIPSVSLKWLVGGSRFLVLWILAALLLEPLVNQQQSTEEKPLIVVAMDHSESMVAKDSSWREEYPDFLEQIQESFGNSNEWEYVSLGSQVEGESSENWNQTSTDLGALFPYVKKQFPGKSIGGLVLFSDGIYNRGQNPVYASRSATYPIYSVGIGDTTTQVDAWVDGLRLNSKSYVGNEFPIRGRIRARGLAGKSLDIALKVNGEVVQNQNWSPQSRNDVYNVQAFYLATEPGMIPVELSVTSSDEYPQNNIRKRFVQVVDEQKKVLILAGAPHPDINAIKSAIERGGEFQMTLSVGGATEDLEDYQLVVAHDINSSQYMRYRNEFAGYKGGLMIIEGEKINPSTLEDELFNVPTAGMFTERGQWNLDANNGLLEFSEETQKLFQQSPPLVMSVSKFVPEGLKTLATAQIKGVSTPYPVIMSGRVNGFPRTLVRSTNFWRTRMYEYSESENFLQFDGFWNSLFRYNGTFGAQDRLIVNYETQVDKGLPAGFSISVLTADLRPTSNAEVSITLITEGEESLEYTALRKGKSYERVIPKLSPGNYRFVVKAVFGDETLQKSGRFTVTDYSLESLQTTARWDVLQKISDESYGVFVPWEDRAAILEELENSGVQTPKIKTVDRITRAASLPWFFILLILFLTVEWGVRRWSGWY
ncbi:MAG: hypothetical protein SchgKO_22090 [Schleiferiaceae bacterium]